MKNIISFGGGVQTVALVVLNILKDERLIEITNAWAECAIFSDTGWERGNTYDYLKWFIPFAKEKGFIIHTTSKGSSLRDDALNNKSRFASMPLYTLENSKVGMLRRQCTREYKIEPVDRKIRKLSGLKKGQRMRHHVNLWFGITLDEASRMKDAQETWKTKIYPFVYMGWRRSNCIDYLKINNIPVPPKSACVGCPYHNDSQWLDMRNRSPEEWQDAVCFDRKVRNLTKKGVKSPAFLHRQTVPLDEVNLNENQINLFENECEGYCSI